MLLDACCAVNLYEEVVCEAFGLVHKTGELCFVCTDKRPYPLLACLMVRCRCSCHGSIMTKSTEAKKCNGKRNHLSRCFSVHLYNLSERKLKPKPASSLTNARGSAFIGSKQHTHAGKLPAGTLPRDQVSPHAPSPLTRHKFIVIDQ